MAMIVVMSARAAIFMVMIVVMSARAAIFMVMIVIMVLVFTAGLSMAVMVMMFVFLMLMRAAGACLVLLCHILQPFRNICSFIHISSKRMCLAAHSEICSSPIR